MSYDVEVRRAAFIVVAGALVAGCGLVAGLDDQFGYPPFYDRDATSDGTVPDEAGGGTDDGGDAAVEIADVVIPTDVFTPDANEPTPDAAEAGCTNPTGPCDNGANHCCAPAVCNAVGKCVAQCVGNGCGNEAACCFGKHCNEYFQCTSACGQNKAVCDPIFAPCCLGFVCPQLAVAQCQPCKKHDEACAGNWECCSQSCDKGKNKCN
jgi:hypothetical protein